MKILAQATRAYLRQAARRSAAPSVVARDFMGASTTGTATTTGYCCPKTGSAACQCGSSTTRTTSNRQFSTMDDLKSGTETYMSLYPEASTDGALRLGNIVPDFACETTHGNWESFHEWKKGKWAILFSHPADFTPGKYCIKQDVFMLQCNRDLLPARVFALTSIPLLLR